MKMDCQDKMAIICTSGGEKFLARVNYYLKDFKKTDHDFTIPIIFDRFSNGEAKATLRATIRGYDVFIIADLFNYGVTYNMCGIEGIPMSPDNHYQDLKRIISAIGGKARRITVIMPMLYESRQDKRIGRESLDCAVALQELVMMGVDDIITFDVHNTSVQNAIPLHGFDSVKTTYQMIKACLKYNSEIIMNPDQTMIISPDEGGMARCMYYSAVLGMELGTYYKQRDYAHVVNGTNPILKHEYLGSDPEGRNVIIVDDMISTGRSVFDVAMDLKDRAAAKVLIFATFGIFNDGFAKFDEYYNNNIIDKVFTTNLIYSRPELLDKPWYCQVDMSKYIALIINTLHDDDSISELLDPVGRIRGILSRYAGAEENVQISMEGDGKL